MSAGKIMVVEDDLALSAGLCFELDMNGYLTVAAYNTGKARQLAATEDFDLVLLDVNLPDGNGMDLCRELKRKNANSCRSFFLRPMIWRKMWWQDLTWGQTTM